MQSDEHQTDHVCDIREQDDKEEGSSSENLPTVHCAWILSGMSEEAGLLCQLCDCHCHESESPIVDGA